MVQDQVKNIAVLGAGAMGCLFGARMTAAGYNVTLIDVNAERLKELEGSGLSLVDDKGTRLVRPATAAASNFDRPVDLVLLFTKGMHSRSAVGSIKHLAATRPLALTLQNGVGNAEILAEVFGADRVIMGTAMVPADLEPPNRIITHGFSSLHIGGMSQQAHASAHIVADVLRKAEFDPTISPQIETAVWAKLAFNAALNATAMITLSNNGQLDNDAGLRIAKQVLNETAAVALARGLVLDLAKIDNDVTVALSRHPAHEASMLQDRRHGRRSEIDTINGAIVAEGGRLGVPAQANAILTDLVKLIEANSIGARSS